MADIADLPMLHDIDADYSPHNVKLARILRSKIESGEYHQGDILPAADLASRSPRGQCGHIDVARMSPRSPRHSPAQPTRPGQ